MQATLRSVISMIRKILRSQPGSDHALARECLLHRMSYQLPASASRDRWIGFREIARTTRRIFGSHKAVIRYGDHPSAILGGFMHTHELITGYIEREVGHPIGVYIAKAEWPEAEPAGRTAFWLRWMLFAWPLALRCTWSQRRSNLALLIRECADIAMFMHRLHREKIRELFDFLPYEIDSNLIALCCRASGIRVTKIPSSGPLATHNKVMIADAVVFTTPYQREEYEQFRDTIRTTQILKWGPEKAYTYIGHYQERKRETPARSLAFYSHGSWIRQAMDHASDGLGIAGAERRLLADLRTFMLRYPHCALLICVHPRERVAACWQETLSYYAGQLEGVPYAFSPEGLPTALTFDKADIALAAFSTINYERLFCGFKTLIGNYDIPEFPMKGSSLEPICFDNYQKMERLILQAQTMSHEEFFTAFRLEGYRFEQFPGYAGAHS